MINEISPFEFTMACIVCIGYISGKLWIYYKRDDKEQQYSIREQRDPKSGLFLCSNGAQLKARLVAIPDRQGPFQILF